ncbi:hypothetical protein Absy_003_055 [Acetobacter syzygii]|nr:hypothetical protein Absy_003_055 [Acetobacter syzygii]
MEASTLPMRGGREEKSVFMARSISLHIESEKKQNDQVIILFFQLSMSAFYAQPLHAHLG